MLSKNHRMSFVLLLFTLVMPGLIFAEDEKDQELPGVFGLSLEELLNLEVTAATRTPQAISKSIAPVSVITRADIQRLQPQTLPDLLETVVGFTISYNGAPGKRADLKVRGTDPYHVLVLIDGLKANSARSGRIAIQNISPDHIEKIEIVRGPRSSLYGSEALGGVINIITRTASEELQSFGNIGYGSHDTSNIYAGLSGSQDKTGFSIQIGRYDTDGIHIRQNSDPDKDGYELWSLSGVLRHQFGSKSEVEFRVLRTQADTEIDGGLLGTEPSINPLNESVLQIASGSLQTQLADHWNLSLRLGESRDELETFEDGQSTGVYDSRRLQGTVQNDIRWGDNHLITAGLDYFRDKVMGTVDFQTLERDTIGFFGQWQTTHDRHQFIAGLRHDKNDTVEDSTTYNLQWAYEINQKFQLTAAYGTAFRAPGFDQLFFPGFGNPDLRPEKSDTFELGLRGNHEQGYWSFSAYNTVIDDMIAINFSLFRPENIQGVRIRGVEGEVNIISPKWRATLNGSYVDHQDDMSGKMLRRRPKGSLNLSLDRTMGRISFGTKVLWRSHSFDSDGERNRMEDYSLVDVHLAYAVSQQWMIRARINNLFDEVYETTNSFNSLDRTVFLSVTYEM